jgi:hypothetical protein
VILFSMARRRPRIVPSDIKRQTRGFAESPFVIFENLRARKMSHDFLIRGSGCASFARYAFRNCTDRALHADIASGCARKTIWTSSVNATKSCI